MKLPLCNREVPTIDIVLNFHLYLYTYKHLDKGYPLFGINISIF